ncbi:NAD(P)H-binding protein [Pseudonocardia sp. KRD-291]|nr:NAD(P)H-binding protein [Pseudonocardia sp. KRD291]
MGSTTEQAVVLVMGATGQTGRVVVDLLRARQEPVRAASRTPNVISGTDAVRFHWHDPSTHEPALDGVDRVFLVPPPSSVDPVGVVDPFLALARSRGVRRVVMLGSAVEFPNAPGRLELAATVRAEPGWVVLSPSGFMQNFLRPHAIGTAIRTDGVLSTSAPFGRLGWIDTADIAATAAAILTRPLLDEALRSDYVLTGPQALSFTEVAAIISARTGHRLPVKEVTVEQLAARHRAAGLTAEFAAILAANEDDVRTGRYDQVTTSVLELTGRPPRTFEDFVADHTQEWSPAPVTTD